MVVIIFGKGNKGKEIDVPRTRRQWTSIGCEGLRVRERQQEGGIEGQVEHEDKRTKGRRAFGDEFDSCRGDFEGDNKRERERDEERELCREGVQKMDWMV
jgi:hypothetical protein